VSFKEVDWEVCIHSEICACKLLLVVFFDYGVDLIASNHKESNPAGGDARSSGYFLCCNTPIYPLNLPQNLSGTQLEPRIGQQLNSLCDFPRTGA
jgi:hypothetical protein